MSEMNDPLCPLLFGTTTHAHPQHPVRHSVLTGACVLHLFLTDIHTLLAGMHMFMHIFLAHTGMYVFLAHMGGYLLFEIC
jgi:hypothetical protein